MKPPKGVLIFTQPECKASHRLKGFLSEKSVKYRELNVFQDRRALLDLLDRGFRSTPVIVINGEAIAGFAPDRLEEILGL